MDNSNVGSNSPKSATNFAAKFSSITSSSAACSITKASSLVSMICGVGVGVSADFIVGSKLISEAFSIVGFKASLLISN